MVGKKNEKKNDREKKRVQGKSEQQKANKTREMKKKNKGDLKYK